MSLAASLGVKWTISLIVGAFVATSISAADAGGRRVTVHPRVKTRLGVSSGDNVLTVRRTATANDLVAIISGSRMFIAKNRVAAPHGRQAVPGGFVVSGPMRLRFPFGRTATWSVQAHRWQLAISHPRSGATLLRYLASAPQGFTLSSRTASGRRSWLAGNFLWMAGPSAIVPDGVDWQAVIRGIGAGAPAVSGPLADTFSAHGYDGHEVFSASSAIQHAAPFVALSDGATADELWTEFGLFGAGPSAIDGLTFALETVD